MALGTTWRALVLAEAERLEQELALTGAPDADDAGAAVAEAIAEAREAAGPSRWWSRTVEWWSGARIETAWRALHRAKQALVLVQDPDHVRAMVPDVEASLAATLQRRDPRLKTYRKLLAAVAKGRGEPDRQVVRTAMAVAHDASDTAHANVRGFRNLVLQVTLLLTLGLVAVTLVQSKNSGLLPLCGKTAAPLAAEASAESPVDALVPRLLGPQVEDVDDATGEEDGEETGAECPAGSDKAGALDVVAVSVLGAFGALLTGARSVSRLRRYQVSYSLPLAQMLLKVSSGAATALLGILVIQNGVIELTKAQSGGAVLAYAALFGFAQQAVTRQLDSRAEALLGAAGSKDDAPDSDADGDGGGGAE